MIKLMEATFCPSELSEYTPKSHPGTPTLLSFLQLVDKSDNFLQKNMMTFTGSPRRLGADPQLVN
jgi:hypothetical protein